MKRWLFLFCQHFILALALALAGCSNGQIGETLHPRYPTQGDTLEGIPSKLSEFGLFKEPLASMIPIEGVFEYEVNSPLFSDYSHKKRFIYLPEGKHMTYHEKEVFEFPDGSIIFKFFYYPYKESGADTQRILETRVLIKKDGYWEAFPYVWNENQTEAFLMLTGHDLWISGLDHTGREAQWHYSIPGMLECKSCHELHQTLTPIGPNARQLNRYSELYSQNQLVFWHQQGLLAGFNDLILAKRLADWQNKDEPLDSRARSYLESNCGHCHRPEGPARNTGLNLMSWESNLAALGVRKTPIAAGKGSGGLKYDIVPGRPDQSILIYRIQSTEPGVMMPEIGRTLVHQEGVALISEWIRSMSEIEN